MACLGPLPSPVGEWLKFTNKNSFFYCYTALYLRFLGIRIDAYPVHMRKQLMIGWLLLAFLSAFSQTSKPDDTDLAIKSAKGKSKVRLLNNRALELISTDLTSAEKSANRALAIAKSLGDWPGMANSFENLGIIYKSRHDYPLALESFFHSLDLRTKTKDLAGETQVKTQIGKLFLAMSDWHEASTYLEQANSYWEKDKNPIGLAESHALLGQAKMLGSDYSSAELHFTKSLDYYTKQLDLKSAAEIAYLLGETSLKRGANGAAMEHFNHSLKLANNVKDKLLASHSKSQLASLWLSQGALDKAWGLNAESLKEGREMNDSLGIANCHLVFAKIASLRRDKKEMDENAISAAKIWTLLPTERVSHKGLETISYLYSKNRDYQSAYQYQLASKKAEEAYFENEIEKSKITQALFFSKLGSTGLRSQRLEFLQVENANNKRILSLLFAMIGIVGFMAAIAAIYYRKKVSDNKTLQNANEEILRQKTNDEEVNKELTLKNTSLDLLNKRLVEEMTERENLEKSSFARDRFLATMSHEMRTPLNVITGLTHLLLENNPRPDQAEQLRTLQFSANELVVFINDVLDFSKIEAGKLELQNREFDLGKTVDMVFEGISQKAAAKRLLFHGEFDPQIPRKLMGDDARFFQVLTNLLNNAIESTSTGLIRAFISLEEATGRDVVIRITIESESGNHRPAVLTERIWDKELENRVEGQIESQRFTLTITKRLIELQNGRLELENDTENTAKYTVLLPFKAAFTAQNNIIQLNLSDKSYLNGCRVLLVEDNKINQLVVAKLLRKNGIDVVTADNGLEALEAVNSQDFDLILMDIQMPEMDGYRATSEIRRLPDYGKASIPIIALTSSAFLTEKEKAVLFGMNDHVGKPFSPEELLDKISACMEFYKK